MRIYLLGLEFWDPIILSCIAKAVGVSLWVDKATASCVVGEYAIILLEVDVTKELSLDVTFECLTVQQKVKVFLEDLPVFYEKYEKWGHKASSCHSKDVN